MKLGKSAKAGTTEDTKVHEGNASGLCCCFINTERTGPGQKWEKESAKAGTTEDTEVHRGNPSGLSAASFMQTMGAYLGRLGDQNPKTRRAPRIRGGRRENPLNHLRPLNRPTCALSSTYAKEADYFGGSGCILSRMRMVSSSTLPTIWRLLGLSLSRVSCVVCQNTSL